MLSLLRPSLLPTPRLVLARFSSSSSSSSSIPSRVYPGLYFHPHPSSPTPSFTLSYLPTPAPSLAFSPTTLGTLHPLPSSSSTTSSFDDKHRPPRPEEDPRVPPLSPRAFSENPDFMRLVHDVLKQAVEHDPWLQTQAKAVEGNDTFIHITDFRSSPDANRAPHPQDVLASVLVQSGKLVPQSYEPNSVAYRLVSEDGLMQLGEGLMARLVEACEKVRRVEEEVARGEGEGEREAGQ
ncbi:hypothetical protein JCM10207_001668 [Rhodosporidiobolus poonsookiae]